MVTLVDEFADIKIMRFEVPGWDGLTSRQKAYAYHLAEAAKFGVVCVEIVVEVNFLLEVEGKVDVRTRFAASAYIIDETSLIEGCLTAVHLIDARLSPCAAEGQGNVVVVHAV